MEQLEALDNRIEELTKYRMSLQHQLNPVNEVNDKPGADLDSLDGGTHDG